MAIDLRHDEGQAYVVPYLIICVYPRRFQRRVKVRTGQPRVMSSSRTPSQGVRPSGTGWVLTRIHPFVLNAREMEVVSVGVAPAQSFTHIYSGERTWTGGALVGERSDPRYESMRGRGQPGLSNLFAASVSHPSPRISVVYSSTHAQ